MDENKSVSQEPQVGDVGAIVLVYQPGVAYCVECVHDNGQTIWLEDFTSEELELIWKHKKLKLT